MNTNTKVNKSRRQLLVWTAPTIAAVTLPAHAQTSVALPLCSAPPVVSVPVSPKCAGAPPIGSAVLEIVAPDANAMQLVGIDVVTTDPASTLSGLPSLPATLSPGAAQTVTWNGPASDALTCLPLAQITMILEYSCGGQSEFESYDVTALLIASI